MTLADILALTRAGWTKDAITALINKEETPTEEPAEVPEESPKEPTESAPEETELVKSLRAQVDSLTAKVNALQKNNRNAGAEEKPESISDIILNLM